MSDKVEPNKVVNIRGLKLFPSAENKLALSIELLDAKAVYLHGAWMICDTCKSKQKVVVNNDPKDIRICPNCNGFGYLIRLLRGHQV